MKHIIKKSITCEDTIDGLNNCCNTIQQKLEKKFTCKLHAEKENDIVNGSISILHKPNDHQIHIIFYDQDENPNKEHKTKFRKLATIPTESEIKKII